jgi:hypothetical protein
MWFNEALENVLYIKLNLFNDDFLEFCNYVHEPRCHLNLSCFVQLQLYAKFDSFQSFQTPWVSYISGILNIY